MFFTLPLFFSLFFVYFLFIFLSFCHHGFMSEFTLRDCFYAGGKSLRDPHVLLIYFPAHPLSPLLLI